MALNTSLRNTGSDGEGDRQYKAKVQAAERVAGIFERSWACVLFLLCVQLVLYGLFDTSCPRGGRGP